MSEEIDVRVVGGEEIAESIASAVARADAALLGRVEASSYTHSGDAPIAWAFSIDRDSLARRLIMAGSQQSPDRVALHVATEHAYAAMLYAKALVLTGAEPLAPHTVALLGEVPSHAAWYCDAFYIGESRDGALLAVALHAHEQGLAADAVAVSLAERAPDHLSAPDPNAAHAAFPTWSKLVRGLRRLQRLQALDAPEMFITIDRDQALQTWAEHDLRELARWPADLLPLARELNFA